MKKRTERGNPTDGRAASAAIFAMLSVSPTAAFRGGSPRLGNEDRRNFHYQVDNAKGGRREAWTTPRVDGAMSGRHQERTTQRNEERKESHSFCDRV
jgi:hypothetical protein